MSQSDTPRDTPPAVITSIAAGVAPLPFLAVYSVIFIAHGFFYPVQPPDITHTRGGEAVAGLIAVAIFFVLIFTIWWFLIGRRRWSFLLGQLAVLVATIAFVANPNTGPATVPILLIATSTIALALGLTAQSAEQVASPARRRSAPRGLPVLRRRRTGTPAGAPVPAPVGALMDSEAGL